MAGNIILIHSLDDPRLAPFRALKDREIARNGGRFIAESEHIVRRLLDSSFTTESVLLARRRLDEIAAIVPDTVPIYVVPDEMMKDVIGYRFHSGVIACGLRGPGKTLQEVLQGEFLKLRVMVCPNINNTENLGGLIRIAAGFGMDAMILGPESCDPFFRQSIRVSMGTIFRMPLVQSDDLVRDLNYLKKVFGAEIIATVLDDSQGPIEALASTRASDRFALLLGSEAQGLPPEIVRICDRRITIPMQLGTDSLNVMVAAGIFLYQLTMLRP